ncbi:MAG: heavy metal translocating P-type ATPase [Kiritimatiellae bacterium]|nr:heavy metal translocating P-type ATPase [Kiritimatiellia bacterium]
MSGSSDGSGTRGCVLRDLAAALHAHDEIKAVWLDAKKREVNFAFLPGTDEVAIREKLKAVVAKHQPGKLPDCSRDSWTVVCDLCERGRKQTLPEGIRMTPIPDAGVMLEKEACPTAKSLWRWQKFNWIHLRPRIIPSPSSIKDLEEWKGALLLALSCLFFTVTGFVLAKVLPDGQLWPSRISFLLAYLTGGWHPAHEVLELLKKRILDVHFLMLCVAAGAAAIGHWEEGAILLFLFSFSGALEELAMARTEKEIQSLFHHAPKEATRIEPDGREIRVPASDLVAGNLIRVRPDEQFAVDAEVITGTTSVNEANLTGEALPVDKHPGDKVFSGTLNAWGSVDCRVLRPVTESALAKIITLIREAQESKAPSQRLTDKFGTGYTYLILGGSLAMFFVWWLAMGVPAFTNPEGTSAFYRAMTLLVVASPCALVLSIPSAILAGIAASARKGVLFRGGVAIENLAEINRVALDKTGTLTTGELKVVAVETHPPGREKDLLAAAAALGHHSTHPVSRAIAGHDGAPRHEDRQQVHGFRSLSGMGVEGELEMDVGRQGARMGRRSLFGDLEWVTKMPLPEAGLTETLVEVGALKGRILLEDEVRPVSAELIKKLHGFGLKVTMLTGDRKEAADKVAGHLGLDEVLYGLKPEDKVQAIRDWTGRGEKVAMVGDGVNDAPSLAAAHVAIGMGLRGSDAVLEQADVILMKDRLENMVFAYELSRRARSVIHQNLAISLGVIVLLVLSALGSFIPLTLGVVGHEGSTVVVVLNSLRLLLRPPK